LKYDQTLNHLEKKVKAYKAEYVKERAMNKKHQ